MIKQKFAATVFLLGLFFASTIFSFPDATQTAPMLAAHRDNIRLNEKLFRRVKAVYDMRNTLKLDRATALSFRKNILEPFGTEDPMTQYVRFRGAEPKIEPLLRKRGLEVASQN